MSVPTTYYCIDPTVSPFPAKCSFSTYKPSDQKCYSSEKTCNDELQKEQHWCAETDLSTCSQISNVSTCKDVSDKACFTTQKQCTAYINNFK